VEPLPPHTSNWLFAVSTRPRYRCNAKVSASVFGSIFSRRFGTNQIPASPAIHASSAALLHLLSAYTTVPVGSRSISSCTGVRSWYDAGKRSKGPGSANLLPDMSAY